MGEVGSGGGGIVSPKDYAYVSKVKVLGTTNDVTTCERCGRSDLAKTVACEYPGGHVRYLGEECAARVTRGRKIDIRQQAREADRGKADEEHRKRQAVAERQHQSWEDWAKSHGGSIPGAIERYGGFSNARAAYKKDVG
jgi:hypothetical protein